MRQTLLYFSVVALAVASAFPLQAQAPTRVMGAPYHDASRAFIDLMAPHHEMAVAMSEHAVMMRAMMQMMAMQRMSDSATARPMMDSMHAQHHPGQPAGQRPGAMPGQQRAGAMSHDMMGGGFDRMFLEHMIAHHQDGIEIALITEHSEAAARVKEIAKKTRENQEREIAEMRRILASLPSAPTSGRKP